jgi:hypothetical protein
MKHACHATRCNIEVPPKMLMCIRHWRMVPRSIQNRVWAAYRPGQEIDKSPSDAYMDAYRAAVNAVDLKEGQFLTFPVTI